jgi:transcriptional regulator with XRE-family HTH domain
MTHDELDFDKPAFLKALGKHVARVRKSKGYSIDRLSLESGMSTGTVSKLEAGTSDTQITTLARIAEIIGVPLSKLLDFKK